MTYLIETEFDQQQTCGKCVHWRVCEVYRHWQRFFEASYWLLGKDKQKLFPAALANCCVAYSSVENKTE